MTTNKRAVERFMDAFRRTDREHILSCLADDVEWEVPGAFSSKGKNAFGGHIVDEGFEFHPEITVTRMIEQDDIVIAEGRVRTRRRDGSVISLVFCDVFEMHEGLIRRLTSYLVEVK